jgi:uncharacterized membrane protein/heat shock protein HslJ
MKTKFALPLLALTLAACTSYPPGPGYPPGGPPPAYPAEATYRAIGTEPFWDLEIGRDMVFTDRGNDNFRVVQPTPRPINGVAGEIYQTQRLNVNIVHSRCSDGMSDRTYPDTVQVRVDGREFRGCGAPIAFFSEVGVTGQPNYPGSGAVMLTGTNWRVTAINGRQTPPRNFYMNFIPDRIGAKFGCNSLGAGYSVNGSVLTAGAVMATRMASPDMSFENEGSAILALPMNIAGGGDRLVLSNSAGSIELVRAE